MNYTENMLTALRHLRQSVESATVTEGDATWGTVYLDNAQPMGWANLKWAAVLGALARVGKYRPADDEGFFGEVMMGVAEEKHDDAVVGGRGRLYHWCGQPGQNGSWAIVDGEGAHIASDLDEEVARTICHLWNDRHGEL